MSTHDIELPSYQDLMLPTLQALDRLGGTATIEELDPEVARLAKLTAPQVDAEFRADQAPTGSIVAYRGRWARTSLKKAGAVDNPARGRWVLLPKGREYLDMPDDDGQDALIEADREVHREIRAQSEEDRHDVRAAANERYAPAYEAAARWREMSLEGVCRSSTQPSGCGRRR